MTRHNCPGDWCPRCNAAIDAAETARDYPDDGGPDWQAWDDAWERSYDREASQ